MARRKRISTQKGQRRDYPDEFKEEAVQMLLDGHSAPSVVERLGISNANMLYRWKKEQLARSGPVTVVFTKNASISSQRFALVFGFLLRSSSGCVFADCNVVKDGERPTAITAELFLPIEIQECCHVFTQC
jgi:hypothetical protein